MRGSEEYLPFHLVSRPLWLSRAQSDSKPLGGRADLFSTDEGLPLRFTRIPIRVIPWVVVPEASDGPPSDKGSLEADEKIVEKREFVPSQDVVVGLVFDPPP